VAGVQRPGDRRTGAGRSVAPDAERGTDAAAGHKGQPQAGLVAVPGGPCLESSGLCPGEEERDGLSCVRRDCKKVKTAHRA